MPEFDAVKIMWFLFTMVVVPFFLPIIRDIFCNMYIAMRNAAKGEPTFRKGSCFAGLLFASGYVFPKCYIKAVHFGTVTFAQAGVKDVASCITLKKSALVSGKVTPLRFFNAL